MGDNIIHFFTHNMTLSIIFAIALIAYIIFEVVSWSSGGSLVHKLKISVNQLISLFNHNNGFVIDVRSEDSYQIGHILDSVNVLASSCNHEHPIIKSNRNRPIIIVCDTGKRSSELASHLHQNGIKEVFYLNGGLEAWRLLDMPLAASRNKSNDHVGKVIIYTKPDCPYSLSAKNLLRNKGLNYKEIVISAGSPEFINMVKLSGGLENTPQIFINNKHIGDFDALKKVIDSGDLVSL